MIILAEYGVALTLRLPIIKAGSQNFAVGADWTPAAGDVKVIKDGASANIGTLPTATAHGNAALWTFSLTAAEMQAQEVTLLVSDAATKAVEDQLFVLHTYGNASARHKLNLNDSVRAGLTALPNANAGASGGLPTIDASLRTLANVDAWRGTQPSTLNSGLVQGDVERWLNVAPNALVSGRVDANAGVVGDKTGYALTVADKDDIVDRAWDEARASHVAAGSFGQAQQLARSGTAQAGASGSITLDAGASAVNDFYKDDLVFLIGGTGAGQARRVSSYAGSTKVASVTPAWATNPDATSVFVVIPVGQFPSVSGAGALQRTIGVTVGGNPLEGASIWLATDAAGSNVIAGPLTTSSQGTVTVLLDAGTYYVWMQKDGYNAIIGQSVAVS